MQFASITIAAYLCRCVPAIRIKQQDDQRGCFTEQLYRTYTVERDNGGVLACTRYKEWHYASTPNCECQWYRFAARNIYKFNCLYDFSRYRDVACLIYCNSGCIANYECIFGCAHLHRRYRASGTCITKRCCHKLGWWCPQLASKRCNEYWRQLAQCDTC